MSIILVEWCVHNESSVCVCYVGECNCVYKDYYYNIQSLRMIIINLDNKIFLLTFSSFNFTYFLRVFFFASMWIHREWVSVFVCFLFVGDQKRGTWFYLKSYSLSFLIKRIFYISKKLFNILKLKKIMHVCVIYHY